MLERDAQTLLALYMQYACKAAPTALGSDHLIIMGREDWFLQVDEILI